MADLDRPRFIFKRSVPSNGSIVLVTGIAQPRDHATSRSVTFVTSDGKHIEFEFQVHICQQRLKDHSGTEITVTS